MTDDLRELLVRHLPGYQVRSVAKLGEGWDNVVHEVNGELVVRRSRDADVARRSATTRREVELLEAVAELSALPVPEPVFADPEAGVLAYRKLPGEPLEDLAYGFRTASAATPTRAWPTCPGRSRRTAERHLRGREPGAAWARAPGQPGWAATRSG